MSAEHLERGLCGTQSVGGVLKELSHYTKPYPHLTEGTHAHLREARMDTLHTSTGLRP